MKKHAISFALYGLPAVIILTAFAFGHSSINPEEGRSQSLEASLKDAEQTKPSTSAEEEEPAEDGSETDNAAVFSTPDYQYYPFPSAIVGNVPNTNKLFSFEIAVSIFDTALAGNVMISTLEEREPQLRPLILENAVALNEDVLLYKSGRDALAENIKDTINTYLARWGYDPFVHSVEITSFIIT